MDEIAERGGTSVAVFGDINADLGYLPTFQTLISQRELNQAWHREAFLGVLMLDSPEEPPALLGASVLLPHSLRGQASGKAERALDRRSSGGCC